MKIQWHKCSKSIRLVLKNYKEWIWKECQTSLSRCSTVFQIWWTPIKIKVDCRRYSTILWMWQLIRNTQVKSPKIQSDKDLWIQRSDIIKQSTHQILWIRLMQLCRNLRNTTKYTTMRISWINPFPKYLIILVLLKKGRWPHLHQSNTSKNFTTISSNLVKWKTITIWIFNRKSIQYQQIKIKERNYQTQ